MSQKTQYVPLALLWDIIAFIWTQFVRFVTERVENQRERAHGRGDCIVINADPPAPAEHTQQRKAS